MRCGNGKGREVKPEKIEIISYVWKCSHGHHHTSEAIAERCGKKRFFSRDDLALILLKFVGEDKTVGDLCNEYHVGIQQMRDLIKRARRNAFYHAISKIDITGRRFEFDAFTLKNDDRHEAAA